MATRSLTRILINNEQLAQVNKLTFPYLGSLITEDGEVRQNSVPEGMQSGHECRKYGNVTAYRFQRR